MRMRAGGLGSQGASVPEKEAGRDMDRRASCRTFGPLLVVFWLAGCSLLTPAGGRTPTVSEEEAKALTATARWVQMATRLAANTATAAARETATHWPTRTPTATITLTATPSAIPTPTKTSTPGGPAARVVASMLPEIVCEPYASDAYQWSWMVSFVETRGITATIESIGVEFVDRCGDTWREATYIPGFGTLVGSGWFSATVSIPAYGSNSYADVVHRSGAGCV